MDKKKRTLFLVVTAVLVTGLVLTAVLPGQTNAAQLLSPSDGQFASPARPWSASLSGSYLGQVELDYVLAGTYNDPLPPPDPNLEPLPVLGSIDLGLQLTQSESGVEGYVDLEHTLVFTTEHTVGGAAFGPLVTGSFDGTHFSLESERVSLVSSGQNLMRQFQLTGGFAEGEAKRLVGEYRETLWGYGTQPQTVVGRFTLDWDAPAVTDFLYLPLVSMD
jgi:hypothetical protein